MYTAKKLIVLFISLLLLVLTTGCGDSPGKPDENIQNVKIKMQDISSKELDVGVPELAGMKNESLQKKINENLKNSITALMRKGNNSGMQGEFSLVSINEQLLVILFDGWNNVPDANGNNLVQKAIHIDLTTGKVYEPTEIFKKNSNYEAEILKIAQSAPEYRLYDPGTKDNWPFGLFRANWDAKKQNQFFVLGDDYLWVYTFSTKGEGLVPGYGIPYEELDHLIDPDSNLWKAFVSGGSWGNEYDDFFVELPEYELDVKARAAEKAAAAKAAAQKAAAQKSAAAKAAAAKVAAQKAAAQKAAAAKAAAQKVVWKTTNVVQESNTQIVIHGQYINKTSKTMVGTNWNKLTVYYTASATGQQKSFTVNYNTPTEKLTLPGASSNAWFRMRVPNDYLRFVKVVHQFNYSTR